jgi:CheY-like chemotaxis protein
MKRVVLLVDSDDGARFATACDLRGAGFVVTEAPSDERALQRMGALLPHAIVLEIEQRAGGGRKILTALHQDARLSRIPVIALLRDGDGERPEGVRTILREPHDPLELVAELRAALDV